MKIAAVLLVGLLLFGMFTFGDPLEPSMRPSDGPQRPEWCKVGSGATSRFS